MRDFGKFLLKAGVRKLLTIVGTILLSYGVITDAEAAGFVGLYLEEVAGAALLAGAAVWEYIYQRYVKDKVVTALSLEKGASTETLKEAMGEKT